MVEKGIYANTNNYVVFYGYRRKIDIDGCTWHQAPPPPLDRLRKENGGYSLKWVGDEYEQV